MRLIGVEKIKMKAGVHAAHTMGYADSDGDEISVSNGDDNNIGNVMEDF